MLISVGCYMFHYNTLILFDSLKRSVWFLPDITGYLSCQLIITYHSVCHRGMLVKASPHLITTQVTVEWGQACIMALLVG